MANNYWVGTTDDWGTAGNWSLAATPLTANNIIFDGRSVISVAQGTLDGESGAATATGNALFHIKKSFTGSLGTATEPVACAPVKMIIEGSGTYHILVGTVDQDTSATITDMIINTPGTVYLYGNCNDAGHTAQITNLTIVRGTVYLKYYTVDTQDCNVYVVTLRIAPTGNSASNATVYIEKDSYKVNGAVATNLYMQNGTLTCDSMLGTVEQYGGTINYGTDLVASPEADLNITMLRQYAGTFNWYPDDSGNPEISEAVIYGGSFLANGTTNNDRAKVLGSASKNIYLFSGAVMNLANGMGLTTTSVAATATKIYNFGGTITLDNNTQIAVVAGNYDT